MSEPLIIRTGVAAPIDAVRRALTEPAQLRAWLAEHAEADLSQQRFEFWGRYTPEGDAPHQRLLHADDSTLRFAWLLDGVETTTEIVLEATGERSTLVTLTQSHWSQQEMMEGTTIRGVLQTFWYVATANLADHVEGRPLTARVDFTSAQLRADVLVDAPADVIFDALTDGAKVTDWFGYPIAIEPKVGGRYAMGGFDNPHPAKVLELVPGRKLAVDWGEAVGVTTWELEESDGATRLSMVQSGFDDGKPPYAGWCGNVSGLAELRRYAERSDWQPIWPRDEATATG